jgi:hypothetical protein
LKQAISFGGHYPCLFGFPGPLFLSFGQIEREMIIIEIVEVIAYGIKVKSSQGGLLMFLQHQNFQLNQKKFFKLQPFSGSS